MRNKKTSLTSLEKGLNILNAFELDHLGLSAQEISDKLNIPISTIYRYIDILTSRGLLEKNRNNSKYHLGLQIFRLGHMASLNLMLIDISHPHLFNLQERSGETSMLFVLNGWHALCLERIESSQKGLRWLIRPGESMALHAGATATILLAYQEESFIDEMIEKRGLTKFTEATVTDPDQLKRKLRIIREQGYAFSNSEANLGAAAIGAPVFSHEGKTAAGISIGGPQQRFSKEVLPGLIDLVKETANRISSDLA